MQHVCNMLVWEWYKIQLPNTARVFVALLLDALVVTCIERYVALRSYGLDGLVLGS